MAYLCMLNMPFVGRNYAICDAKVCRLHFLVLALVAKTCRFASRMGSSEVLNYCQ